MGNTNLICNYAKTDGFAQEFEQLGKDIYSTGLSGKYGDKIINELKGKEQKVIKIQAFYRGHLQRLRIANLKNDALSKSI